MRSAPGRRRSRAPLARVAVGEQPRERELGRLGDRVLGHCAEGRLPAVDATFTIRPHPRAIPGIAARIARNGAITFSSQASYQSSSGTMSRSRQRAVPALLTRTSRRPKRSSPAATIRSPAPASVTSRTRTCASPPAARHSSAASASASAPRATSSAGSPSSANRRAVWRPIPRLAPVTAQAFPPRPRSIRAPASGTRCDR